MFTKVKIAAFIGTGVIIVGLIMAVLWLRGTNAALAGERDVIKLERDNLAETNKQNAKTIEAFRQQRIDNDAIASAVAAKLEGNRARTEQSRRRLKEAQNDAAVRNWANQPVPNGVRTIIEAPAN